MSEPESSNSHNPEPSKPKDNRYKKILKWILMGTSAIWRMYRLISKAIEFFAEFLG